MTDSARSQGEWLKLAAETALDFIPGGKAMKAFKGAAAKLGIKKVEKQLLKEARRVAKRVEKGARSIGKNFNKIPDILLKKRGIDAHKLKREWLGDKAKISCFDLYKNKTTGEILILSKGGQGIPIHTGEFIK